MNAWAMPASRYIFGSLPWYSVTMVTGIVAALCLALREEKRRGLPKDTVVDLALRIIPWGIIGARLYYVAFTWDMFRERPLAILEIWRGGLAIYGALLGGLAAAAWFARRRKLSLLTLADMIVPGLALAQCIGRWGNYFNMEAYGLPIDDPAWQFFPAGVLIPEGGTLVWHMATFFYESLWDLGVFCALQGLRRTCRRPGALTCWYVLLYGGGRLIVEGLRMDSLTAAGGGLRVSQLLSVAGCLGVFLLFSWRALQGAGRRAASWGLGTGLLLGAAAALLPAPAPAFYSYTPVFCLQTACIGGVLAALAAVHPGRKLLGLLPGVLALLCQGACYALLAGQGASPGAAAGLCALYSLCLIAACGGVFPFAQAQEQRAASPAG